MASMTTTMAATTTVGTAAVAPDRATVAPAWRAGAGVALAIHGVALAAALLIVRPALPVPADPVVLVELPPVPDDAVVAERTVQPLTAPLPPQPQTPAPSTPRVAAPAPTPVTAPRVAVPVAVPVSAPAPAAIAPTAPPAMAAAPAPVAAPAPAAGPADARAKRAEADYFAMVSAHLNRRKTYPVEAKKAREQGIVTVRFTVDRTGAVSNVSIKKSSGHTLLDDATISLLARVAPLPRMPSAIARDSVTIALPIDYSLRT